MSADTNSAAPSSMVPGSDNNTTVSGGSAANAQPNSSNPSQGPATPQAGKFAAGTVTPQAGNSEASTPRTQQDNAASPSLDYDALSLEDAIVALKEREDIARKERAEAARYRKKAQEYDALLKEQEDAKLSETEKLQKQLAEYQVQVEALNLQKQEIALRARVDSTAAALGLKPELALRILDQSLVAYDDMGFPTNIRELLEQAMTDYDLAPRANAGPSNPNAARMSSAPAAAAPYQQGRYPAPPVPATGATNPPRGAGAQQPLVRSLNGITWKRGQ